MEALDPVCGHRIKVRPPSSIHGCVNIDLIKKEINKQKNVNKKFEIFSNATTDPM